MIYEIRKITGESKAGHTGTLDPDVTGVLPVCIGKATKLVGQLTDTDKTYRCRMRFGIRTDTQDLSGQVLEELSQEKVRAILLQAAQPEGAADYDAACRRIRDTLQMFTGQIEQIPPMFSALKVGGMKLVNAARKGVVVERKPRTVTVHSIGEVEISEDLTQVCFTVHCSKGTYVRTLCEDIGSRLGIPACMEELERIQAAGFTVDGSLTLAEVKALAAEGKLEECVIPTDAFLRMYPSLTVTDDAVRKLIYGNYLYAEDFCKDPEPEGIDYPDPAPERESTEKSCPDSIYRIYDRKHEFYALYRCDEEAGCYKCIKMFRDTQMPSDGEGKNESGRKAAKKNEWK